MKITSISAQVRNPNRVNVSIDGVYRLSLDIAQVIDLGVKIGREYSSEELKKLEEESELGKLYMKAVEYCLMRPHSAREIKDYLFKKTRTTKYRQQRTGEVKERAGVSQEAVDGVYDRLEQKGYIDDEAFAKFWVEHRHQTKGASKRRLQSELRAKGVPSSIVEEVLVTSGRDDGSELQKVIDKKRARYPDDQKFMRYLAGQGFNYDDIKSALGDS